MTQHDSARRVGHDHSDDDDDSRKADGTHDVTHRGVKRTRALVSDHHYHDAEDEATRATMVTCDDAATATTTTTTSAVVDNSSSGGSRDNKAASHGRTLQTDASHCGYYLAHKRRYCRTARRPGSRYCPTHDIGDDTNDNNDNNNTTEACARDDDVDVATRVTGDDNNNDDDCSSSASPARVAAVAACALRRRRVPCPINRNHTVYADKLQKHLRVCPDLRFVAHTLPYYVADKHANRGYVDAADADTHRDVDDDNNGSSNSTRDRNDKASATRLHGDDDGSSGHGSAEACTDVAAPSSRHARRRTHHDLTAAQRAALVQRVQACYATHIAPKMLVLSSSSSPPSSTTTDTTAAACAVRVDGGSNDDDNDDDDGCRDGDDDDECDRHDSVAAMTRHVAATTTSSTTCDAAAAATVADAADASSSPWQCSRKHTPQHRALLRCLNDAVVRYFAQAQAQQQSSSSCATTTADTAAHTRRSVAAAGRAHAASSSSSLSPHCLHGVVELGAGKGGLMAALQPLLLQHQHAHSASLTATTGAAAATAAADRCVTTTTHAHDTGSSDDDTRERRAHACHVVHTRQQPHDTATTTAAPAVATLSALHARWPFLRHVTVQPPPQLLVVDCASFRRKADARVRHTSLPLQRIRIDIRHFDLAAALRHLHTPLQQQQQQQHAHAHADDTTPRPHCPAQQQQPLTTAPLSSSSSSFACTASAVRHDGDVSPACARAHDNNDSSDSSDTRERAAPQGDDGDASARAASAVTAATTTTARPRRLYAVMGKHLCGACTDFSLSCLADTATSRDDGSTTTTDDSNNDNDNDNDSDDDCVCVACVLATCCHHRCELRHLHRVQHDVAMHDDNNDDDNVATMTMTSAAAAVQTSATTHADTTSTTTGVTRDVAAAVTSPHEQRLRLRLQPQQLPSSSSSSLRTLRLPGTALTLTADEFAAVASMSSWAVSGAVVSDAQRDVGVCCKRVIDAFRVAYLQQRGYCAALCAYTQPSVTQENVCIVAWRREHAVHV